MELLSALLEPGGEALGVLPPRLAGPHLHVPPIVVSRPSLWV